MDPLAAVQDVEQRLGRVFVDTELGRVVGLLQDASELARLEAGQLWAVPASVPGAARAVVLRVVERAIRNPDGFSAESDGDYSYQRTQVEPGVYLTESEKAILRKAAGRSGLWTQATTRGDCDMDTVWFEDSYGCELFPLDTYRN